MGAEEFEYQWDEVGRLAEAARWDLPTGTAPTAEGIPTGAVLGAKLRHAYDAGDQRVLKTAIDSSGAERHTVYVFGSLELRRAGFGSSAGDNLPDFELSKTTEVPYLFANGVRLARVAWEDLDVPSIGQSHLHVLFELGDHLGSTSVVLDRATSELVERSTFQAYGAAESDYRPARWAGFREDYRFTGKEEDVEVGLQYFGKRYYAPLLNRWVSADPLAVHGLGGDLNLYAYVNGRALKAIDPLGLQSNEGGTGQPGHSNADLNSQQHPKAEPNPAPGPDTGAQGAGGGGPGAREPIMSEPESNFTPGAGGAASQFYGGARGGGGQSHGGPPIAKPSQTPSAGEIILVTPLGPEAALAGVARGALAAARGGAAAWRAAKEAQLLQRLERMQQQITRGLQGLAADSRGSLQIGPKFVPNPGGRLGDAVTRATADQLVSKLEAQGLRVEREVRFRSPGGLKENRYADLVATDPTTGERQIFQIGRTTKGGLPVKRERGAIIDIANSPDLRPGDQIKFVDKFSGKEL